MSKTRIKLNKTPNWKQPNGPSAGEQVSVLGDSGHPHPCGRIPNTVLTCMREISQINTYNMVLFTYRLKAAKQTNDQTNKQKQRTQHHLRGIYIKRKEKQWEKIQIQESRNLWGGDGLERWV